LHLPLRRSERGLLYFYHGLLSLQSGRGFGFGMEGNALSRDQSYTVEISKDNENWSMLIDKSNNPEDLRHDYTELREPVKARYVKLTKDVMNLLKMMRKLIT